MKKVNWFIMIVMVISLSFSVSALYISEVEMNPEGTDHGNEWIELYSENEIDLDDYYLENNDEDIHNLSGIFSGYLIIKFPRQWLDNTDEKVMLKKGNEIIDESDVLEDKDNNKKAWSKCDNEWVFIESSEGKENLCNNRTSGNQKEPNNNSGEGESGNNNEESNKNKDEKNEENVVLLTTPTINNKKEKIVLNSPREDEGEQESKTFISKREKLRLGIIFAFLVFTIFLVILLALKKL